MWLLLLLLLSQFVLDILLPCSGQSLQHFGGLSRAQGLPGLGGVAAVNLWVKLQDGQDLQASQYVLAVLAGIMRIVQYIADVHACTCEDCWTSRLLLNGTFLVLVAGCTCADT